MQWSVAVVAWQIWRTGGNSNEIPWILLRTEDRPVWLLSKNGRYSNHQTWIAIRVNSPIVDWWKVIWFPLAIPKHPFIMWLAIKNRLRKGDRLIKRGYKGSLFVCFVGVKWNLENICFSNVALVPEFGKNVWLVYCCSSLDRMGGCSPLCCAGVEE